MSFTIETVNPATNTLIKSYNIMQEKVVTDIIDQTYTAQDVWRETSFAKRKKCLTNASDLLKKNKAEYAKLISIEMGKPIVQARSEIEKCMRVCEYYADNAEALLQSRNINTEMKKSQVVYCALGVIFAIMPWNFPFWQIFRFVAPNLMAGNAVILSHASIATGCSLAIEDLLKTAGFLENIFRSVIITNAMAGFIVEHPKIVAVTLTGSERAGASVARKSGNVLKKIVLELGGSDPYVILADADIHLAVAACVVSRMNNAGQVCISAKRIIIVDALYDAFEKAMLEKIKTYTMGDPLQENTKLGPLARKDLRDAVHTQVHASIQKGAVLLTGGEIPDREGFYYPATILKNVKKGMPAYDEEIFGPVICLLQVKDEEEAIHVANDSRFGLAAAVFTTDEKRGLDIAIHKIHAGTCWVNGYVASDPRLPFGGIKSSGYGRELSREGIHEFVNAKTVCIKQ